MSDRASHLNRRSLLKIAGVGTGCLITGKSLAATQGYTPPTPVDTGHVANGKIVFPPWRDTADTPSPATPSPLPPSERVGFAVVGLGRLAVEEILPAFGQSTKAKPVALVSGSPEKMQTVAASYGIPRDHCYDYASFDRIQSNPEVQAVYIALPNAMHRAFCERAAAAGKHVLTEKPMSVSSSDAQAMVDACARANVKLMVAYRIQYEPYNRRAMQLVRSKQYGRLVAVNGINTQTVAPDGHQQWRHKRAMAGGGSLVDIGLYCLNTSRFILGEEPTEIFATMTSPTGDDRFAEVEETISFMMRFPSNAIANCLTSYGARDDKHQRLNLERAVIDMPNAYQYGGQRLMLTKREGDATSLDERVIPHKNQFALELDHMADCIKTGRKPYTPGEEGVQDHKLMEAVYESARTNKPISLPSIATADAFRGPNPPDAS